MIELIASRILIGIRSIKGKAIHMARIIRLCLHESICRCVYARVCNICYAAGAGHEQSVCNSMQMRQEFEIVLVSRALVAKSIEFFSSNGPRHREIIFIYFNEDNKDLNT